MNAMTIRKEQKEDYEEITKLVKNSFSSAEHTDGDEHNLVQRLRTSNDYIPEITLVAVVDNKIVGYIMFSHILIGSSRAIALAPLAVLPEYQRQGIGKSLIKEAHKIASQSGFEVSVVLGSPYYYSKFGYEPAIRYNIYAPFDVPDEYFMIAKLQDSCVVPSGSVHYSNAFL